MAASLIVAATAEGATSQWTANTGTKVAAVASPDDDITTYVSCGTTSGLIQQFTGNISSIPANAVITQIDIYYRYRRGGLDADFFVGYIAGSNLGNSGTITSTSSWAGATWSHTGLSFLWPASFTFYVQNTQTRNVLISTLYATVHYLGPLIIKAGYYARLRNG